jgi:hypothetical protein
MVLDKQLQENKWEENYEHPYKLWMNTVLKWTIVETVTLPTS